MEFTMMERLQYFDMLHGMAHKEVRTKGRLLFDLLEFPFKIVRGDQEILHFQSPL